MTLSMTTTTITTELASRAGSRGRAMLASRLGRASNRAPAPPAPTLAPCASRRRFS
jgi:hypothetical protein